MKGKKKSTNYGPYIILFIIVVVILIGYYYFTSVPKSVKESYTDDKDMMVRRIHDKFDRFFDQDRYWEKPLHRLNDGNIMDEVKVRRGDKSYTLDKKDIFMCMKKEDGSYYNENMLIYVFAHEISHVLCKSIGHTSEFHEIFQALLHELEMAKIYDSTKQINLDYCKNGDPEI